MATQMTRRARLIEAGAVASTISVELSQMIDNPKTTEMLIVYMAMSKGTVAADPAATAKAAKAGSAAATTFGSLGAIAMSPMDSAFA